MPHTRSAKKNLRKIRKRRLHNRSVKGDIKEQLKTFAGVKEGSNDELMKEFKLAVKKLDKAAAKRIIHPNTAARKKSQLAKLVNKKTAPAGK
jgi:small subunit ribosomal protein S20